MKGGSAYFRGCCLAGCHFLSAGGRPYMVCVRACACWSVGWCVLFLLCLATPSSSG